jgi:hypothetical protein
MKQRDEAGKLTVTELIGFAQVPSEGQTRLSRPWTFHFRVP